MVSRILMNAYTCANVS